MNLLVIVESPNKTAKVAECVRAALPGHRVHVRACLGHLRDLPADALGVDGPGFAPRYVPAANRSQVIADLRHRILAADKVLLATDPDREGEAVAWHVYHVFKAELAARTWARISFNAITPAAIDAALRAERPLDVRRVQSAVARRVADRLIGYTLSPRLWAAVPGKNLSVGRVQTVALGILRGAARRPDSYTLDLVLE